MECISHNDNEEKKECSTVEREGKEQEEILQLRQQNLELKAALEASEAENRAKTSFFKYVPRYSNADERYYGYDIHRAEPY